MKYNHLESEIKTNQKDRGQAETYLQEESEREQNQSFLHSFIYDNMKKGRNRAESLSTWNNNYHKLSTEESAELFSNNIKHCRLYAKIRYPNTPTHDIMRSNFQRLMSFSLERNLDKGQKVRPKCLISLLCPKIEDICRGESKRHKSKPYTHLSKSIINKIALPNQSQESHEKIGAAAIKIKRNLINMSKCRTQNSRTYCSLLPNDKLDKLTTTKKEKMLSQMILSIDINENNIQKGKHEVSGQTQQIQKKTSKKKGSTNRKFITKQKQKYDEFRNQKLRASEEFRLLRNLLIRQKL